MKPVYWPAAALAGALLTAVAGVAAQDTTRSRDAARTERPLAEADIRMRPELRRPDYRELEREEARRRLAAADDAERHNPRRRAQAAADEEANPQARRRWNAANDEDAQARRRWNAANGEDAQARRRWNAANDDDADARRRWNAANGNDARPQRPPAQRPAAPAQRGR